MALGIFDIIFKVSGAGDAVQALRNIKSEAKQTSDAFEQTKKSSDDLGKQFQGLLAGAAIAGFAKSALDAAVNYDSLQRALATTVGSTSELTAEMDRLRKIALLPGINLEQTVKGFIRLRSAKFDANTAEKALMGVANAVASVGASADTVDRVITAMSQLANGTQVNQEELNQLREALPSFGKAMELAFGTQSAEKIRAMGISGADAAKRIADAFNAMPKASAGLQTAVDNVADTYNQLQVAVGNVMASMLVAFGPAITSALENTTRLIQEMTKAGSAANVMFKALIAIGLAAFIADVSVKFGMFVKAIYATVTALRALTIAEIVAKAAASPAAAAGAIASILAATGLTIGAFAMMDKMFKTPGIPQVEASGNTKGTPLAPLPKMPGEVGANYPAAQSKSTDAKSGGGLISTMIGIAEYAARMQSAFVDMAKSMEGHLFEIAKNTGSTRDLLDLRKQTFGGGRLGAIGVTAAEIQNAGNNPTNVGGVGVIPQTLIPASTDLERSMRKMMIQYGRQNLVTEMRRI
jgi:tape measure domain-containing protein